MFHLWPPLFAINVEQHRSEYTHFIFLAEPNRAKLNVQWGILWLFLSPFFFSPHFTEGKKIQNTIEKGLNARKRLEIRKV